MAANRPSEPAMQFLEEGLNKVLTLSEVEYLWGKTRKTIELRCLKGDFHYRKSITGGTILIWRASVEAVWGKPAVDFVRANYLGE